MPPKSAILCQNAFSLDAQESAMIFHLAALFPERARTCGDLCQCHPRRTTAPPPRARCNHNVIHQNGPFSGPLPASLSVAGPNLDDTTFSMLSNVIIFAGRLSHPPSWSHPQTPPMRLDGLRLRSTCRSVPAIPHTQNCLNVGNASTPVVRRNLIFYILHPAVIQHPASRIPYLSSLPKTPNETLFPTLFKRSICYPASNKHRWQAFPKH
jgi:hypothetical protein